MNKSNNRDTYREKIRPRLEDIRVWAMQGLSLREIAIRLGVGTTNFWKYAKDKKNHKDLVDALSCDEFLNQEVQNSLLISCFDHKVKRLTWVKLRHEYYDERDKKVVEEKLEQREEEQIIPACFQAQRFWLINKMPEKWKPETIQIPNIGEKITIVNDVPKKKEKEEEQNKDE